MKKMKFIKMKKCTFLVMIMYQFFVHQMKTYNKNRKNFFEKNSIEREKIFSVK